MLRSCYDFDLETVDKKVVRCEWVFCDDTDPSLVKELPFYNQFSSHVWDGFEQGTNEFGERASTRSKPHRSRKADAKDLATRIGNEADWNSFMTIHEDNCQAGCELWSPDGDDVVSSDGVDIVVPEVCGCEIWSPDGDDVVSSDGVDIVVPEECGDCDCEIWSPDGDDSVSSSEDELVIVNDGSCC